MSPEYVHNAYNSIGKTKPNKNWYKTSTDILQNKI